MLSSTSPSALNDATAELKAELKKIGIFPNIDKCLTCAPSPISSRSKKWPQRGVQPILTQC
jgi:hypothetical protein